MCPEQTLRIIKSQDLSIVAKCSPPKDMTGWAITFQVKDKLGGTSKISKTVGSGVTITNGPKGIITIALAKADTSSLDVSTSLSDGYGYVFDIKRTDSGNNLVLARGQLILEETVTT